jgi:sialidase-1
MRLLPVRARRLLLLLSLAVLPPSPAGAAPILHQTDLFEAGRGGYALYRIPGIIVTARGTVLAYCEARKHAGGDWGHIDILMRRSTDGGKTWEPARQIVRLKGTFTRNPAAVAQKLGRPGEITVNNPVAIADAGTVHFLYCVEYGRCFSQRSSDEGRTFSAPVEITAALEKLRPRYPWRVLATGPGHGIRLRNGRLLVPVWLSRGTGGHAHRPSALTTIYSDDRGKTWHAGAIVASEKMPLTNPNESVAVQLADGRVMLNIRSESKEQRRAVAYSKDGASGWSVPAFHSQLLEPICMASLVRLSAAPAERNRLLFANPDNLERADGKARPGQPRDRKRLTVKLSYDEGRTWPTSRVLAPGPSGYSDLAVGPDGTIYCFYERGSTDGKSAYRTKYLSVARFNLEWLTRGKDALRRGKRAAER